MYLLTSKEAIAVEEQACKTLSIDISALMDEAGKAVAEEAKGLVKKGSIITIISGKGNNGGDGFVAARNLTNEGYKVKLFLLYPPSELKGIAAEAFKRLEGTLLEPLILDDENIMDFDDLTKGTHLFIDAIFGFGLKGAIKGKAADVIQKINRSEQPVLSVDIPSGLEADSGRAHGECIRATKTVTFTCPKVGMVVYPGVTYCGEIITRDIGIPQKLIEADATTQLISKKMVKESLPPRPFDAHKKSLGRVLVIAGSPGMTGAACLTALAALRSGAGIVTLGVPESINPIVEEKSTEIITVPLPETSEKTISLPAFSQIKELQETSDVIAVGPGLSREEETVSLVQKLARETSIPMVIDADGLNALAEKPELLSKCKAETILTPHPGELGRLLKTGSDDIQSNRLESVQKASQDFNSIVILKGANSIISSPEGNFINPTGNQGMASAGTGDVLTGLVSGFLAQTGNLLDAAVLGTYIHGLAGDLAASTLTPYCLIAGDLLAYLPRAMRMLLESDG